MGQDLLRFAAENDTCQTAAAMRGHADKIAFFLLGYSDDLLMDVVTLDQRGVQRNSGSAGEMLHRSEEFSGLGLVVPRMCFGQISFAGP